jgi:hypothetical protein
MEQLKLRLESIDKKQLIKKLSFISAGALIGFGYYYFIGCTSGSCPITGNPYISTLYGAAAGLLFSLNRRKNESGNETNN